MSKRTLLNLLALVIFLVGDALAAGIIGYAFYRALAAQPRLMLSAAGIIGGICAYLWSLSRLDRVL